MITGTIYSIVSIDQLLKDNIPMSLTYFAYALSNVGLWMAVTK